jgi:hypothetical protein
MAGWVVLEVKVLHLTFCWFSSAGLYPPQSHDEVVDDIEALRNTVELILDEIPIGDRSEAECNSMRDKVAAAFESLREAALQLTPSISSTVPDGHTEGEGRSTLNHANGAA